MNTKSAGWVMLVVGIAALGIAWHSARRRHLSEAARADVAAENARLVRVIGDGERRLAASKREHTALRQALETARKPPVATPGPAAGARPPASAAGLQTTGTIAERLQKDPQYQLQWLATKRAELTAKYGPFYRSLGLTPAQIARFEENFIRREEKNIDYGAISLAQNREHGQISAELWGLMTKVEPEHQAAQRELLGDDGYRQWRDYERTVWVRNLVNGWAGGAAVVARDPFTPQQGEQLVRILANASATYRNGGDVRTWEIDWDSVDAQVRQMFSDAQFKLFKTMEPPLPVGGRFQSELYRLVDNAQKVDAQPNSGSASNPPGE
jgi:hypothetical protein